MIRAVGLLSRARARVAAASVAALVLASSTSGAADKTDVVVLTNGDRITGEVKLLAGGRLQFKTDKADTIQIKWDGVAQVTSGLYFEVLLDDARRLYGSLLAPTAAGMLRVGSDASALDVPLKNVAQINRLRRSFFSRLQGSIDLGISYTQADTKTEWNLNAETSYRTPTRKIGASLDSLLRRSTTDDVDRDDATAYFQRFWSGRWLTAVFGTWQRNTELALDRRLLAGGGGGFHLIRTVENDLVATAGIAVSSESFSDEREPTESVEALFGLAYNLYALGKSEFTMTAGLTVFPSLSVRGRVRFESALDTRKELFKDFYFNVRFFDSFDNRVSGMDTKKNDFGVTTSLGWSF